MEGSLLDEDPVSDDSTCFSSFTPITLVHEAAGAKQRNSLHDRFTALASPPSGNRRVKLEITTSSKYSHDFIFWLTTLPLVSHPIEVVLTSQILIFFRLVLRSLRLETASKRMDLCLETPTTAMEHSTWGRGSPRTRQNLNTRTSPLQASNRLALINLIHLHPHLMLRPRNNLIF